MLGRPIPRFICIDETENRYSVETVTKLPGTGWQAVYPDSDPVSFDAAGNCYVQLRVKKGQSDDETVSSVEHTTILPTDINWSNKTGLIRVLMEVEDGAGNVRTGGKGSTHVEDTDDGGLGEDDQ